jgi:phenylalanyl-tRNA synthetase beta chain
MRIFLQKDKKPLYRLVPPKSGQLLVMNVSPDVGFTCLVLDDFLVNPSHQQTARIRPYFAGAILRNIRFTPRSYASFIDLQDKLHQNIGRRRQLVSIGTHDLDTIEAPFRYEARPPKDINFVPLNKSQAYDASELMTLYEVMCGLARIGYRGINAPISRLYTGRSTAVQIPPHPP